MGLELAGIQQVDLVAEGQEEADPGVSGLASSWVADRPWIHMHSEARL